MTHDGRKLNRTVLAHLRQTALRRYEEGERVTDIMKSLGLRRETFYKWLKRYREGGEKGLEARKARGAEFKLAETQRKRVKRWIVGKDPRQYGFDFGLWTRKIVQQMIHDKFGVDLGLTSVGRLLTSLEITPQKPLVRAYQRDEKAIRRWRKKEYPLIAAGAKRRRAKVFFLDESGIRSDVPCGKTYGLKGKTPVVKNSGWRQQVNAISAVNARGAFWHTTYTGRFNATRFVEFLKDFRRSRRSERVVLIVDRHPVHLAAMVERFVKSTKGGLKLEYLPGYAPELNPDEQVWRHLKREGIAKKPLHKKENLRERVEVDLVAIKRRRDLIRSFFRHPDVLYTNVA